MAAVGRAQKHLQGPQQPGGCPTLKQKWEGHLPLQRWQQMTCSDRAVEALLPEVHCQLAIFCGVFAVKTPQPSKRNGIAGVQRKKAEAGEVAGGETLLVNTEHWLCKARITEVDGGGGSV